MNELQAVYQAYLNGQASLADVQRAVQNSPEQAQQLAQQMAAQERGERVAVASGLLDLLKNIGFTAYSLNQIGQARRNQPNMPGIPSAPGLSPELTQAIYQAQRGVDFAPTLEPARQGIEDAYTSAITRSADASGGQAGAYQAMAQLANVERMRAQLGLAPIAQQVQMENQSNLNNLLGARVDERNQQYRNQLYGAQMGMDNYWNQIEGLSGQLTAGNQNLLNSIERTTNSIQNLSPYFAGFDDETRNYMERVRNENISNFSMSKDPMESFSGNYRPDYRLNQRWGARYGEV